LNILASEDCPVEPDLLPLPMREVVLEAALVDRAVLLAVLAQPVHLAVDPLPLAELVAAQDHSASAVRQVV